MQIVLKRLKSRPQATDGQLYINNVIVADTAEATPYMLSEGVYDIKIENIKKYHRKMPVVCSENTPVIRIGNGVYNSKNADIIIGEHLLNGIIIHSAPFFNKLIDRLDKAAIRGEKMELKIKNCF